jgi:penicillin amidase
LLKAVVKFDKNQSSKMSKLKQIIKRCLTAILYILALSSTLPAFAQSQKLAGLKDSVRVYRDSRGIAYLEAKSDYDLYFVQGYITASDRLWQMDIFRRVAGGETAEIFGKTTLAEDKRWRTLGFAKIAEAAFKNSSKLAQEALTAYAAGVNAYITSLKDEDLPLEFKILKYRPREWKPEDSIIVSKILSDALSNTWRYDLLRVELNKLPKEKLAEVLDKTTPLDVIWFGSDKPGTKTAGINAFLPAEPNQNPLAQANSFAIKKQAQQLEALRESSLTRIGLYLEDLAASNNWVISGRKTADGNPILANDPHLQPTAPGIWYIISLQSPSHHAVGVSMPGIPGILLGHNDNIAWGATNVGPDVQDLYRENCNPDGECQTADGKKQLEKRTEVIKVRENPLSPATREENHEVLIIGNGPVILQQGTELYSLKWTALDPRYDDLSVFLRLNRAQNWKEFCDALRPYGGATQNFVYADKEGHIGWHIAGAIPIRRRGDGSMPYDAASKEGDWIGTIPFDELPYLFDPANGFIVTANQRIVGSDYKYQQLLRDFAPPWRARRLYELISSFEKLDKEKVSRFQFDAYSLPLKRFGQILLNESFLSPEDKKAIADWDGQMLPDSRPALILNELRNCLSNAIAQANPPLPAAYVRSFLLEKILSQKDKKWLPMEKEDFTSFYTACYQQTQQDLTRRFGSNPEAWVWGKFFTSKFNHPLAAAPLIGAQFALPSVPLRGSSDSPNVGSSVSMRFIALPKNWDNSSLVIPLGQSGNIKSKHFSDQFESWKNGLTIDLPFSSKAIQAAKVSEMVLEP